VSRARSLLAVLIVLGLFAALVPAAALAGGSSAGDNQYVDPLSGVHSHSGSSSSSPSSSSAGTSATAAASATSPTATTAGTTSTGASSKSKTLPFTGFDDWQAAALGGLLVIGGLGLRRRAQT
jgi:cytoskeletal protein RodZ